LKSSGRAIRVEILLNSRHFGHESDFPLYKKANFEEFQRLRFVRTEYSGKNLLYVGLSLIHLFKLDGPALP